MRKRGRERGRVRGREREGEEEIKNIYTHSLACEGGLIVCIAI